MLFICTLRHWIQKYGSKNIVYFDESGFNAKSYRTHGWAKRGRKIYGKITGNSKKGRTNLIMAQRKKKWLAPLLFEGSCTHELVTMWVKQFLIPELNPNSLIIMDNAPFHNKAQIRAVLAEHGHTLLPLPTYSPDLNPIEKSFANIKKRKHFSKQSLDQIIISNC